MCQVQPFHMRPLAQMLQGLEALYMHSTCTHQEHILVRLVNEVVHVEEGKEVCASPEGVGLHANCLHSTAALL